MEMPGPWKAWKSKSSFPTLSTVPWKSRRKREIPTFPPPLATTIPVLSLKTKKTKKGSRPLRGLLILHPVLPSVERDGFHAHLSIRKCFARMDTLRPDLEQQENQALGHRNTRAQSIACDATNAQ